MSPPSPQEGSRQRAERAATASSREDIESFFRESAKGVLVALAGNPSLQEQDLLRLLERRDLPREAVTAVARHTEARRSYNLQLALARHPKAPRPVSLPLLKFFHLFDLLRVAETPGVPADVKMAAEGTILRKLEGAPRGEKISLARRGTGRLAASLLDTSDLELIHAALDNPFLTEGHLLKVLARDDLPAVLVQEISHHQRWSHHYHLRLALIRNPLTPLACVLEFLPHMAVADLRDICRDPRMPPPVRNYITTYCARRVSRPRAVTPPAPPKDSGQE